MYSYPVVGARHPTRTTRTGSANDLAGDTGWVKIRPSVTKQNWTRSSVHTKVNSFAEATPTSGNRATKLDRRWNYAYSSSRCIGLCRQNCGSTANQYEYRCQQATVYATGQYRHISSSSKPRESTSLTPIVLIIKKKAAPTGSNPVRTASASFCEPAISCTARSHPPTPPGPSATDGPRHRRTGAENYMADFLPQIGSPPWASAAPPSLGRRAWYPRICDQVDPNYLGPLPENPERFKQVMFHEIISPEYRQLSGSWLGHRLRDAFLGRVLVSQEWKTLSIIRRIQNFPSGVREASRQLWGHLYPRPTFPVNQNQTGMLTGR